ncbi:hypothetical protein LRS05_09675 [Flavobacterium sp. J372]|uniref:bestrophin family protein n=1 Tax=Flavobacterium sp. J372 TaxID=2898436 RepID=UPI00215119FE|nr:bestrophin family ion channel [Flavobacterium sp. J372]MCR5862400.1 hypothetical protein [Flavobacterium sp. J372]
MLVDKRVPIRYIFKMVKYEMLIVIILATVIYFIAGVVDPYIPEMPLTIATFLGTGISVLLSFKMSQSYDRWWEARKIWGAIVNDSRSFVLQLQAFLKKEELKPNIRTMAYRQVAWCYSLGQSLRGLPPLQDCEQFISDDDIRRIHDFKNKPLALLQLNVLDLKKLRMENELSDFESIQLNSTSVRFSDSMGAAERINNTVFPTIYRMFLHFIIYLFVAILGIAMKDVGLVYEIPLLLLISFVFFTLEKAAYYLQGPFP